MEKLVKCEIDKGARLRLVLLDREFFSTSVITRLKELRQTFLMPCKKTAGIKKAIAEYVSGNRQYISRYTMKSGTWKASFTLVMLPKARFENENTVYEKYLVFATNISRGQILECAWAAGRIPLPVGNRDRVCRTGTVSAKDHQQESYVTVAVFLLAVAHVQRMAACKPHTCRQNICSSDETDNPYPADGVFHTLVVKSMTGQDEDYALHKAGAS